MSLFENVFKSGGESKEGGLFSDANKFKARGKGKGKPSKNGDGPPSGQRKRPAAIAFEGRTLSKYNKEDRKIMKTLSQGKFKYSKKGNGKKALKEQAGKVAGAAADARRLAVGEDGGAQQPKAKKQKLSKADRKAARQAERAEKKKLKRAKKKEKAEKKEAAMKIVNGEQEVEEEPKTEEAKAAKEGGKKKKVEKKEEKKAKQAKKEESSAEESESESDSDSESDSESESESEEEEEAAAEGVDANAKLAKTIFVGNLPKEAKKKGLTALFSK